MKDFSKLGGGQKGFTLIELLVVVAILGTLSAIAIPNVAKFIGTGKAEAGATELHNIQLAVVAAMADAKVGTVANPGTLDATHNVVVSGSYGVGTYILGGIASIHGTYTVLSGGSVVQINY